MAEYISFQPSDFFNPTLYTGTGSELTVTGVGFQSDISWLKDRSASQHHQLYDSVRGAGEVIYPNLSNVQGTVTQQLKSWNSDGYVIGTDGSVNTSSNLYASWNWKAGSTSGKPTTDETLTPTSYSYSATQGLSILKYTGTGSSGLINHGLGVKPKLIIVKNLTVGDDWLVYSEECTGVGYGLVLNTTAEKTGSWSWDCNTTANTFEVNGTSSTGTSQSGQTYVAYCFANVQGYQKSGKYVGNGNADGTFVYTGFRPALVITKYVESGGTGGWNIQDDKRNTYNAVDTILSANTDGADSTSSGNAMDFLSNGFKWRANYSDGNTSGGVFLYLAIAQFPLVSSNDIPVVGR